VSPLWLTQPVLAAACVPVLLPLLLCVQAAGGVSHNGQGSMLDLKIADTGVRSVIAVGSAGAVGECVAALQAGQ
jgi:fructose-1,6-bisphosphatase